eukprot:COSAG02_NODE_133_length_34692_cov_83.845229_20_plen_163_part_00
MAFSSFFLFFFFFLFCSPLLLLLLPLLQLLLPLLQLPLPLLILTSDSEEDLRVLQLLLLPLLQPLLPLLPLLVAPQSIVWEKNLIQPKSSAAGDSREQSILQCLSGTRGGTRLFLFNVWAVCTGKWYHSEDLFCASAVTASSINSNVFESRDFANTEFKLVQ